MEALVVDDSKAMRAMLTPILRELGFTVHEAAHGAAGLERIRALCEGGRVPRLAIVDLNMPQMNGLELTRAVRAERALDAVKLVVVSADADEARVREVLAAGAQVFLGKPFAKGALLDKLRELGFEGLHGELVAIVAKAWQTILGLAVVPASASRLPPQTRFVSGSVQLSGAWAGVVNVECSIEHARRIAAAMFAIPAAEVTAEQFQDAVGEMTNIVGGNLKGVLPRPCEMSLPTVVDGLEYTLRVPTRTQPVVRIHFECEGLPLSVAIMKHEARA